MVVVKEIYTWDVDVITPSESLINKFSNWDKSKSSALKLRSYNRARKWVSDLLKRPLIIPDSHELRNLDLINALEDMTDALAMPGGITYDQYLVSCLAPPRSQDSEQDDDLFQDAEDQPNDTKKSDKYWILIFD